MRKGIVCLIVLLLGVPLVLGAQSRKDPLNEDEIDQIREYADRPPERVKLYMKFIEQRATALKELNENRRAADRTIKIRNRLDEITRLLDELQDNLDEYEQIHADLRKVLKELIPASDKWLEIITATASDPSYDFGKKTALEAAKTTNDAVKDMLPKEEAYFAAHKKDKDADKREK